ncbi:MAG: hypothetical protein BAJALOKI3v1_20067 [Promethearchaeota archaeon]|nr:MAG: hypothetical protein BAJALOKI3v1_20067 [Candidatus Lokiarchaeota archaeon]
MKKVEEVCKSYKRKFSFKPTYHIDGFEHFIIVRFRILTDSSEKVFNHQPIFANDIYKIIQNAWQM